MNPGMIKKTNLNSKNRDSEIIVIKRKKCSDAFKNSKKDMDKAIENLNAVEEVLHECAALVQGRLDEISGRVN